MVRVAPPCAWDPIGARGFKEAADEYDIYAPQVLEMLKADAPVEQIADCLTSVVRDLMGLPARPERYRDIHAATDVRRHPVSGGSANVSFPDKPALYIMLIKQPHESPIFVP